MNKLKTSWIVCDSVCYIIENISLFCVTSVSYLPCPNYCRGLHLSEKWQTTPFYEGCALIVKVKKYYLQSD